MINYFTKFGLKRSSQAVINAGVDRGLNNTQCFTQNNSIIGRNKVNLFNNIHAKNYLNVANKSKLNGSDRINLKAEFQEMLNETKISEEEIKMKKTEEILKKKEAMSEANKEWEKKNEDLKNEWEEKRMDSEDAEGGKEKLKEKLKSSFRFKKSMNQDKEENIDKDNKGSNGNGDKNGKNDKDKSNKSNKTSNNSNDNPNVISRFISGFAKVWKQTFPGEENIELLLEKRKQEALILKSKIKEASEEEITDIEAAIPEWKRGALVLVESETAQEKYSIFDLAKKNLAYHVKSLKIYQETQKSLKDSEISLLLKDFQESYSNVRENLKESQNPFFVVSRDLIDRVSFKSPSSQAISIMRKFDPHFELLIFEKEVDAIFKQLMNAYLKDNLDTVKALTSESALAVLTSEIKSRRERVSNIG